ncbi:hypothetical protein [Blastococcus sp. TML/C7B]|uniref:hypothetical protein n=1 Tax=Blastococcus sp. TML/C7B TaxID=2798728 RepID=UPI001F5B8E0A|nr:hypothetical protein [Blastococcus sp. TML/C7B]
MSGTAEALARAYAKRWLWKAAAPVAVPVFGVLTLLLIPLAVLAAPEASTASSSCSIGGTGATVAGTDLDAVQMGHAQTIVTVAAALGLDPYAATVALATRLPGVPHPNAGQRGQQPRTHRRTGRGDRHEPDLSA